MFYSFFQWTKIFTLLMFDFRPFFPNPILLNFKVFNIVHQFKIDSIHKRISLINRRNYFACGSSNSSIIGTHRLRNHSPNIAYLRLASSMQEFARSVRQEVRSWSKSGHAERAEDIGSGNWTLAVLPIDQASNFCWRILKSSRVSLSLSLSLYTRSIKVLVSRTRRRWSFEREFIRE